MNVHRRWALVIVLLAALGLGAAPEPEADKPVLHIVLIELKRDAPPGTAEAIAADCKRLLAQIPGVKEVRAGRKALDERDVHVKDYDVGLLVRLDKFADLAVYAADNRHQELLASHQKHVARYRVMDFFGE